MLFVVAVFQFFAAAPCFVDELVSNEPDHRSQDQNGKHMVITAVGRRLLELIQFNFSRRFSLCKLGSGYISRRNNVSSFPYLTTMSWDIIAFR
jgi:hypothetical protein